MLRRRRVALDLSQPTGREAFRRIAVTCQIVAHDFTPRVMRKFGIDYESISAYCRGRSRVARGLSESVREGVPL